MPDSDSAGRIRFPSDLNFKVEHYLSCSDYEAPSDYDRKTTEILIAAKRHDCFDTLVMLLSRATARVENAFLKAEFEGILNNERGYNLIPPRRSVEALVRILDVLDRSRESATGFRQDIAQLQLGEDAALD